MAQETSTESATESTAASVTKLTTASATEFPQKEHSSLVSLARKHWGLLAIAGSVLVGGTLIVLQLTRPSHSPQVTEAHAIAVDTVIVRTQTIPDTLELSGTIHPVEQAVLSTRVMGRITQISLEAGDRFHKGDILAQIDVVDMAAQTNQAQFGVAQAEADLSRSRATLSQLEAQRLEMQATLRLAQVNQRRMAQLQKEGAISQSQLDEVNTRAEETSARLAQSESGIQQAQAAIAQSQAAVNRSESGVAAAAASESYGTVIAPFDGAVVQKLAYEGEMAAPGTALLKVENPNRLQLEISVPEENLRFVRIGQSVQVRVDAIGASFTATIQQIVPTSDATSRSFLVKVPIPTAVNRGIISGMFGRIELPRGTRKSIFIPSNALLRRGQLEGVYVTQPKSPTALLRWVKTGKERDGQVEIVSGLVEGDRVIISNLSQLSDGQALSLRN
ncbi:Efflux transporter periplasmic adaptor subunit [Tumidithrix helvetica PCC 7403]|uniref:efflux RND transporter periplasmic adaptor subunit n=1 Tax=Tumidithrix helvetica TaxID=3457545 RepID=UPI003C8D5C75